MGKPHPIELRARAVALVKQGKMHTEGRGISGQSSDVVEERLDRDAHRPGGARDAGQRIGHGLQCRSGRNCELGHRVRLLRKRWSRV